MGRLEGKVAIVTGATSGIGKRIAELFAEEGAKVALAGRREAEGRAAAEAIGEAALFVQTDVAREADVQALIAATLEAWGRLDCLVNNAGGPAPRGGIESLPIEGVDAAMAVLFNGVLLGMKHAAPVMKRQGSGSIINIGSVAAHLAGFSSSAVYAAAKAAVVHFSRCVAMELGESGVRVNSISPGAIATGIFGKALGLPVAEAEKTAARMPEFFATVQPIKRSGMPDDIARCALYLASDEAGFVNGIDIVVDGGLIGGRHWTPQHQALQAMREAIGVPIID
jgi:NAD(P)-dependent dehydrogenase (short-subunit alcohol dehydrogenase family)